MSEVSLDEHDSIFDWLLDVPASQTVFDRYGLDCSCGGKSLRYASEQAGIDWKKVLHEARTANEPSEPGA